MTNGILYFCAAVAIMAFIQAVVAAYLLVKFCKLSQNLESWTWRFSPPSATEQHYQKTVSHCHYGQKNQGRIIDEEV
jgi:hypothetical protein